MSKYTHFTKLKYLIFPKRGSTVPQHRSDWPVKDRADNEQRKEQYYYSPRSKKKKLQSTADNSERKKESKHSG
jgi:hypothetical protein